MAIEKKNYVGNNKVRKAVFGIVFIVFLLYAVALLTPYFYGFVISVKENGRAFMRDPVRITFPFYFNNYIKAFESLEVEKTGFFGMFFNSIWYSVGTTLFSLFSCTCTAYVISKYEFKGKGLIYSTAIVVMMIPIYGSLPARYRLYTQVGFINSPLILIASLGGFGTYFIYIHAFFKSLSWSYAEAAFIDGAGNFKVFFTIMVPMLLPSLSALAVMSFVGAWNNYSDPLLFLPKMPPLASGLYTYEFNMRYTANHPVYFAGVIISLIPVISIFAIFQNTIMSSVYTGGLKG
ncbi:MAG: carbohydrate ABC transporter permease [Clostridia bacterium]|nr:carbohydrate ABC transporter permease [Clostridia bacterium]